MIFHGNYYIQPFVYGASMTVKKVIKRDGRTADFDRNKITEAIFKAAVSVGGKDLSISEDLSNKVMEAVNERYDEKTPTVEDIQDIIEHVLIKEGHSKTAKAYILYRQKRKELREFREAILGMNFKTNLSLNALKLLKDKYLLKDELGNTIEAPNDMFRRVAKNVAKADSFYESKKEDVTKTEEEFYQVMYNLDFLPNSPTLMNAGTDVQQLMSTFVLPIEDSIESIFEALKNAALIHKTGAGTGFTFSKLRPKNDMVNSTKGTATGPISFMKIFDMATDIMKQGGRRRGANMGILMIDHPDIMEFITAKDDQKSLTNFNISVGLTDRFMKAVEENKDYPLINPIDGTEIKRMKAREIFNLIMFQAWKTGDPGLLFMDRINKCHPLPDMKIEATDSCASQPLLPYEAAPLGSINLANMVDDRKIDFEKLKRTVHIAVHFLDNVIDVNKYPLKEIKAMCQQNRKIGLGVMGFADMLYQLKIPYNSEDGAKTASKLMKFIRDEAELASLELAKDRGVFPNWKQSIYAEEKLKLRNATLTTIAPTGSISIIADVSTGIEPNISLCYVRKIMENREFFYVNPYFEDAIKEDEFYSEAFLQKIKNKGSLQDVDELSNEQKKVFVVAYDISPEWHLKVQAAFQKYTDNAISKTVNFKGDATVQHVEKVYWLAYELGCKGVTIYRDGSKSEQIFSLQ